MATEGGPSFSSHEDKRQCLTCPLCLDILTEPKVLPCSHMFCLECLKKRTSSLSTPTFPCPRCRTEVTVPAGGMSAFRSNVYIRPEDLDLAREGTRCLVHPDQGLDLYCTRCELPACQKCVLVKHMSHPTHNLCDAARKARAQLSQVDDLLQAALTRMTRAAEVERRERQDLQDKKAALRTVIRRKHGAMVAVADTYRGELLASLDTVCGPAERDVDAELAARTGHQRELGQLRQRLQQALSADTACSLVFLAKEMREGKGVAQTVEDRTSGRRSAVSRPVLNSTFTLDRMMRGIKDFFGAVDTMEMRLTPGEVVLVEERFAFCRKETDTAVFSLCPLHGGGVLVSYANCGSQNNNTPSDLFDGSGNRTNSLQKASGNCSFKSRGNGKAIFVKSGDSEINTYSKNKDHYKHHLKLCHGLHGKASISRVKVTSENPLNTQTVEEFTINVGPHRGFDVDSSEQNFAVVEESQVPAQPRKVKLFQRNTADAIATYRAPSTPFNPSDVCFVSLGGKEVLTIADEAGDSVHLVHVPEVGLRRFLSLQTVTLTFVRHLAPGCPKVVQPTALNTDHRGRLWVACRGGTVLTMSFGTS